MKNVEQKRASSFRIPKTPVIRSKSIKVKDCKVSENFSQSTSDIKIIEEMKDLEVCFQKQISLKCRGDNYFFQNSDKTRFVSSKKSLTDLGNFKLTPEQAIRLIPKLPDAPCIENIKERIKRIEEETFPRIWHQLRNRFNVIVYGFGSKLSLIDRFVKRYLREENCVVIPGFDTNVNVSQIFNNVIESYGIQIQTQGKSLMSLTIAIRDFFNKSDQLYFVISNIENLAINSSLDPFVFLTKSPNIKILASVDHRFSERLMSKYDMFWIFHDWTTLMPYNDETRVNNSRFMSQNSIVGLDSLKAVTASIHQNAKQVFLLLAKFQLERKNQKCEGMLIEKLLSSSMDSLLVTNEMGLRNLLTEFKDHKLIQIKMGNDGSCYVKITLDNDSIQKFIDNDF